LYSTAVKLSQQTKAVQSSTLLTVIGEEADTLVDTFTFAETDDKEDVKTLLEKFDEYFRDKKNLTVLRHEFDTRKQQPNESIDEFVTALRALSKNCEYGTITEELIRDRIVVGVNNTAVRAQLLQKPDLTLAKALETCKLAEATKTHLSKLSEDNSQPIHTVSRKPCNKCGRKHEPRKCPAYGKKCNNCHELHHFARKCRKDMKEPVNNGDADKKKHYAKSTSQRKKSPQKKPVNALDELTDAEDNNGCDSDSNRDSSEEVSDEDGAKDGYLFVDALGNSTANDEWYVYLKLDGSKQKFKIDSGAKCNVLSEVTYKKIDQKRNKLTRPKEKLVSYTDWT
jgi:hypothetical protein